MSEFNFLFFLGITVYSIKKTVYPLLLDLIYTLTTFKYDEFLDCCSVIEGLGKIISRMQQYFLHDGMSQTGPFSKAELKEKQIISTCLVWTPEMTNWKPAVEILELQDLFTKQPPPLPYTSTASSVQSETRGRIMKFNLYQLLGLVLAVGLVSYMIYSNNDHSANAATQDATGIDNAVVDSMFDENRAAKLEAERVQRVLSEKNRNFRNNWPRFIQASHDVFTYNVLGGIKDLEVVIDNNTDNVLDEITVAVSYIKDNGGTYKTELVTVYNVPAHGKAAMPAPDSDRGTSIQMNIRAISSKSMNFCYNVSMEGVAGDDPYFCKSS